MSSLHFDITVDTHKLDEELKKANMTWAEYSKTAEQAGQKVDQSFQKSTATLRQEVSQQKQLIKEIENELKTASAERDKMTRMQDKSNANVELSAMKKSLAEENQKLLNLQNQQIAGNQKEKESQGGIINSLKDWAIGLATAGAAVKVFKMIAESTETSSHLFEQAVAGMTAGVGYFFKAIASGDWKGFGTGLKTAITGGVEYVTAMEHINNLKNEQKVKSAALDIELGKNWQNVNSTDQAIKIQALKNIKELTKTKLTQEAVLANAVYAIHLTAVAKENGLSEKEVEDVSIHWSKISDEVEKGEKVLKARAILGTKNGLYLIGGALAYSKEEKAAAHDYLEGLGEFNKGAASEADKYADIATKYGKVGKERAILSTEAATGLSATAAIDLEGKLVAKRLAAAQREAKSDRDAAAKKAKEDAELDNRIKATQELMKTASGSRLKQLAEEYIALSKLKAANNDLIDQAIKLARNPDGTVAPKLMTARGKAVSSQATPTIAGLQTSTWTQDPLAKAYNKQDTEELQKQAQLRDDILNSAGALTGVLVQNGILSQEAGDAIGKTLEGFKALTSGDFIGAAMSTITMIMSMIPTEAEKFAAQVDHINQLLKIQQELIEKSKRSGGEDSALQGQIDLLEKQKALQEEQLLSAQKKVDNKIFHVGPVWQGYLKDVRDLTNGIQDTQIEIEKAQQQLNDFLAGSVTENVLADSIAEGFKAGKTSVNDFADYMNTVLLDAVMNIFKGDILADMQPLLEKVRASLSDKKLTTQEKDAITVEAKRVADENQQLWKDLTGSLNTTGQTAAQSGMVGTIQRSLTEATGTEWVGLARRQADDTRIVRDYTKAGLNNLLKIEANTGETVAQLKLAVIEQKRTVVELQTIVSNTKISYSGKI